MNKITLASLSTRHGIVSGREEIREWENQCAECERKKAKPATQIMALLPKIRFKMILRAFLKQLLILVVHSLLFRD